jgi:hypothetical protein
MLNLSFQLEVYCAVCGNELTGDLARLRSGKRIIFVMQTCQHCLGAAATEEQPADA